MESYKCQVCGFISAVPGEHCGQPMVKQEEAMTPTTATPPVQETTATMPTPAAPVPAKEETAEANPPAQNQ